MIALTFRVAVKGTQLLFEEVYDCVEGLFQRERDKTPGSDKGEVPWSLEDCPQKNVNRWKNISLDVTGYADGFASEVLFEKYTKACTGGKMRREMSGVSLMLQAFDGKHPCRLNVVRHC